MTDVQSYWNSRASGWHKLAGTPLLLNAAELQAIKDHAPQGAKKVLVLGATPPLHDVAPGAHVTCVDIAVDIIKLAQRPDITYHVCSWLDMPIEGYDFVVGCGSLNMIRWRDEYVRLLSAED